MIFLSQKKSLKPPRSVKQPGIKALKTQVFENQFFC